MEQKWKSNGIYFHSVTCRSIRWKRDAVKLMCVGLAIAFKSGKQNESKELKRINACFVLSRQTNGENVEARMETFVQT